jgi:hypothetical protein
VGQHTVEFDASSLSSGVYFYRLTAGGVIEQKKMVLLEVISDPHSVSVPGCGVDHGAAAGEYQKI